MSHMPLTSGRVDTALGAPSDANNAYTGSRPEHSEGTPDPRLSSVLAFIGWLESEGRISRIEASRCHAAAFDWAEGFALASSGRSTAPAPTSPDGALSPRSTPLNGEARA